MPAAVMDRTRTVQPALYRRYLTMFLDGVRADRGALSDLPTYALDEDHTQTAMRHGR